MNTKKTKLKRIYYGDLAFLFLSIYLFRFQHIGNFSIINFTTK